jgi:hypothetical protein
MSDLDEGRDNRGAVDGAARPSGDLPHNDSPTNEIRQNRSQLADRNRLGIILLPSSSWPDGTVFSQRHHQQGLAHGDKEPRKPHLVNISIREDSDTMPENKRVDLRAPDQGEGTADVEDGRIQHNQTRPAARNHNLVGTYCIASDKHTGKEVVALGRIGVLISRTRPEVVHSSQLGLLAHGQEKSIVAVHRDSFLQRGSLVERAR